MEWSGEEIQEKRVLGKWSAVGHEKLLQELRKEILGKLIRSENRRKGKLKDKKGEGVGEGRGG